MPSKSKEQKIKKYFHDYRKLVTLSRVYKEKLEDKNLPVEEYFYTALKYDLVQSYNAIFTLKVLDDSFRPYDAFFLRKFMETYAIIYAYQSDLLNEENYKLFKIKSQNRTISEREGNKLKKQFRLEMIKKPFIEMMNDDDFFFLLGATPNQTDPVEIIHSLTFKGSKEIQQKIISNYIECSMLIHFGEADKPEILKKLYKEPMDFMDKVLREVVQPDAKNISKLDKLEEGASDDLFAKVTDPFVKSLDVCKYLYKNNFVTFAHEINRFRMMIQRLLWTYFGKEFDNVLAYPKIVLETLSIDFYLLDLPSIADQELRFLSYAKVLNYKCHHPEYEFPDTEEANKIFKEIYNDYKEKSLTTMSYIKFKSTVYTNPNYLIFLKNINFKEIAHKLINNGNHTCDKNTLERIYKESVRFSHGDGSSAFRDSTKDKENALVIVKTMIEIFADFINKIKKDNRIVLSLDKENANNYLSNFHDNCLKIIPLLDGAF